MDCAGFERELVGLLAGDTPVPEREGWIAELRTHQAACPACHRSSVVLGWLELSPEERRGLEDPGPDYWAALPGRVRDAIGEEQARRARVRGLSLAGAVAALVLLASAVAWLVDGSPTAVIEPEHPVVAESPPALPRAPESIGGPEPALPEPHEESDASQEAPEDVLAALDDEDLWAEGELETGIGEGGWLFPDVDDLDESARRALLDWLLAERARIERGRA